MARRVRRSPRRRRYAFSRPRRRSFRSYFHRPRRPKRIALLPTLGFGMGTVFGSSGGWETPYALISRGDLVNGAASALRNLSGIIVHPATGTMEPWNPINALNPFNFNEAVGLKGLMWGSVASMALRWVGINRKFEQATARIPIVKRFSL